MYHLVQLRAAGVPCGVHRLLLGGYGHPGPLRESLKAMVNGCSVVQSQAAVVPGKTPSLRSPAEKGNPVLRLAKVQTRGPLLRRRSGATRETPPRNRHATVGMSYIHGHDARIGFSLPTRLAACRL
jgi:hypothetical protein